MRTARLVCAFLLVAGAGLAQDLFAWETSAGQDEIKGKPKTVKIEREADGKRFLEQQTEYRPDGKTAERRFWKPDGALNSREVHAYDSEGRRASITYFDEKGKTVRTVTFRHPDANTEEEVDEARGAPTVRKFDDHGRMVELNNGDVSATMTYDERGRPSEAIVKLRGGPGVAMVRNGKTATPAPDGASMRVQIHYEGENKALVTMYGPDGKIAFQMESSEEAAGDQIAQLLFSEAEHSGGTQITRVDATDAQGNWTRRTELKRDPNTQVDEPVAVVHRTITYY